MNETSDTNALAAEFVLGTLDGLERAQAQVLLGTDAAFAAKVRTWERRLGELHLMVEPVEPAPEIWQRIKGRVPEVVVPSPEPASPETPADDLKGWDPFAAMPAAEAAAQTVPEAAAQNAAEAATQTAAETSVTPDAGTTTPAPDLLPSAPAATPPPEPLPSVPPASATSAEVQREAAEVARAPVSPPPAIVPPLLETTEESRFLRRRLRRWRRLALLLLLTLLAAGGLVAAWKYSPERVPKRLQPVELLRLIGITVAPQPPPRRPVPSESGYEE